MHNVTVRQEIVDRVRLRERGEIVELRAVPDAVERDQPVDEVDRIDDETRALRAHHERHASEAAAQVRHRGAPPAFGAADGMAKDQGGRHFTAMNCLMTLR